MKDIFYAVGYPKAGSTSLREILKSASGVYYIYQPEITGLLFGRGPMVTYSCADALNKYVKNIELDENLINVIGDETLVGSFYTGHYNYMDIAKRIKKVHPSSKIILSIREQGGIISSSYKHYISRGGVLSLEDWLSRDQSKRTLGPSYAAYDYYNVIKNYHEVFGSDNVCVLPIELKNLNPLRYASILSEFIGIPISFPEKVRKNSGISAYKAAIKKFTNQFNPNPSFNDIRDRTAITNKYFYYISYIFSVIILIRYFFLRRDDTRISDAKVAALYSESNSCLSRLINIDLHSLGYATKER